MKKGKIINMINENVAVIVPVYNVEKYLENCIRSIITQTYKEIEIVLIDDGSTDNSGKICDEWKEKDSRIKVIHKKNEGLVSAWKEGLLRAESEWVTFVDSDDWIEKNYVYSMKNEQTKNNADIVVTQMKQVEENKEKTIEFAACSMCYKNEELINQLYPIMLNAGGFEKRGISTSRCAKLIRKQLILQNLIYVDENVTFEEDLNITFPTLLDANVISIINDKDSNYCYRYVRNSMLHSYDSNMNNSIKIVYKALFEAIKDKNKEQFNLQLYMEYITASIRNYTNELQNPKGIKESRQKITEISRDDILKEAIQKTDTSKFPLRFKVILHSLKKNNFSSKYLIIPVLKLLKKVSK